MPALGRPCEDAAASEGMLCGYAMTAFGCRLSYGEDARRSRTALADGMQLILVFWRDNTDMMHVRWHLVRKNIDWWHELCIQLPLLC